MRPPYAGLPPSLPLSLPSPHPPSPFQHMQQSSRCMRVTAERWTRRVQERVALQKGFVDFVIGPYYKLVAAAYPAVAPVFDLIKHNREAWNGYDDKMLAAELANDY